MHKAGKTLAPTWRNQMTTNTVASVTTLVNQSIVKKVLTDKNFEVIGIEPRDKTSGGKNITVTIRVDLAANTPELPMVGTDRYSTRAIHVQRIDIKDVLAYRKIEKNELGQYNIAATDVAGFIAELKLGADETDFEIRKVGEVYVVSATKDSLGYCGHCTITVIDGAGGEEEPPVTPDPTLVVSGPESILVGEKAQFEVAYDGQGTVALSATTGAITPEGEYTASTVGTDTITATDGIVSDTATINVTEAPATE